jgi:hypothetical protein
MPDALADGVSVASVKLKFLRTRGEIDVRTRRDRMHSSLAVSSHDREIMIERAPDREGSRESLLAPQAGLAPTAVRLTGGERRSTSCSWESPPRLGSRVSGEQGNTNSPGGRHDWIPRRPKTARVRSAIGSLAIGTNLSAETKSYSPSMTDDNKVVPFPPPAGSPEPEPIANRHQRVILSIGSQRLASISTTK